MKTGTLTTLLPFCAVILLGWVFLPMLAFVITGTIALMEAIGTFLWAHLVIIAPVTAVLLGGTGYMKFARSPAAVRPRPTVAGLAFASNDPGLRRAHALAVILPTREIKEAFSVYMTERVKTAVAAGTLDHAAAARLCALVAESGAGLYVERVEQAYGRIFTLPELEVLAETYRRIDQFANKLDRTASRGQGELVALADSLETEARGIVIPPRREATAGSTFYKLPRTRQPVAH